MLEKIGTILEEGRKRAYYAVNDVLVVSYWNIGREIVEYEQKGKEKAIMVQHYWTNFQKI
jgi:DUF1016 N-terminal domain